MSLKRAVMILLTFLILAFPIKADDPPKLDNEGLPSYEYSVYLMQSQPALVWQMIRKLYVLEHATPVLTLPDLSLFEVKNQGLVIGYTPEAVASFSLGNISYNIKYDFQLAPKVLEGYKVPPTINSWWYIGGGVALFLGGLVTGLMLR